MKTKAAARSLCTGCLLGVPAVLFFSSTATSCDAFVVPSGRAHVLSATQRDHAAAPAGTLRPLALLRARNIFSRDAINGGGTLGQGARRTRNHSSSKGGHSDCCAMSASSSGSGESASGLNAFPAPSGPGAGVINLEFRDLKTGGFKVFLLFFLLGQGRAKDNDTPFSVRDTPEGIRVLIGDETKNESQWDGVLDLSWGTVPRPFFRVDRIDVNEVIPYPGELYILNKLLDGIIDVNGERSVEEQQKLFVGEQGQLASAKAKLASLASL